ncbi:MAG: SixA phosphatase family protein [Ilumatobacteraceae bacterium]
MPLYLVRHAKAGSRSDFDGNDIDRPLTVAGHKQALDLCRRLAAVTPSVGVSSPYLRCVQTIEPLALALDVHVTIDERLAEFGSDRVEADAVLLDLLYDLPDRAVMCSHGDVIPAIIEHFVAAGMRVDGAPQWGKGSVWVLERVDGRFVEAHAWPPPHDD